MKRALTLIALLAGARTAAADSECAAPTACRTACTAGDATACTWLGGFYTTHEMIDGGYAPIGITLLEAACPKDPYACAELAHAIRFVAIARMDLDEDKRVTELYDKACKGGVSDACRGDRKAEMAAEEKECKAGRVASCRSLGLTLQTPEDREKERVKRKAKAKAEAKRYPMKISGVADPPPPPEEDDDEAGGAGTAMAIDEARKAGVLAKPDPIKPDGKKSKQLLARYKQLVDAACKKGQARTCMAGSEDSDAAGLERACTAGASAACEMRARKEITGLEASGAVTVNVKPVLQFAGRGCDLGDFLQCQWVASLYEEGSKGVPPDPKKSLEMLTRACDLHDGGACGALALKFEKGTGVAKDDAKAKTLMQRACDERTGSACAYVADRLVKTDAKAAVALYERACADESHTDAIIRSVCAEVAVRYETGKDVTKDAAKAKAFRAHGCGNGERTGCPKRP